MHADCSDLCQVACLSSQQALSPARQLATGLLCGSQAHSKAQQSYAVQARSLLTAHEGFTSLLFTHTAAIQRPGFVFGFLKSRGIPEDTVEQVKRMTVAEDEHLALFDVPSDLVPVSDLSLTPVYVHVRVLMLALSSSSGGRLLHSGLHGEPDAAHDHGI